MHKKSFRAVSNTEKGCRCTSDITLDDAKYEALAKKWNLKWTPGLLKPRNTKVPTSWKLPNGETLVSAYYDLAYAGKMPNRIKKALGLPYRKRGGPVNV